PVLDRQEVAGATHAALDLVRHQQDAVLQGQIAQPRKEVVRWHEIAALALDRLHEHGGDALRRSDGAEQLLDPLQGLIGGHGAWNTDESSGANRRRWLALESVRDSAPKVRP